MEHLLGSVSAQPTDTKLPTPNVLGGAALQRILPAAMSFLSPTLNTPKKVIVEEDELLAMIDDALAEFTSGRAAEI